jgi:hypothetical protein
LNGNVPLGRKNSINPKMAKAKLLKRSAPELPSSYSSLLENLEEAKATILDFINQGRDAETVDAYLQGFAKALDEKEGHHFAGKMETLIEWFDTTILGIVPRAKKQKSADPMSQKISSALQNALVKQDLKTFQKGPISLAIPSGIDDKFTLACGSLVLIDITALMKDLNIPDTKEPS